MTTTDDRTMNKGHSGASMNAVEVSPKARARRVKKLRAQEKRWAHRSGPVRSGVRDICINHGGDYNGDHDDEGLPVCSEIANGSALNPSYCRFPMESDEEGSN